MTGAEIETTEDIFRNLRANLTNRIAKLTNFTDRSFNAVFTLAVSQEIRELQELTLVSELAGFIDFVGGPVSQEQLEELGIDEEISSARVNELMDDSYLDEFVKIVGITRDQGERASGTVTFTTQLAPTEIPAGTIVTTDPTSDGDTLDFVTTESARTDNTETSVSGVDVQAVEPGERFKVPANDITRVFSPPIGVTGVTNPESTTGGQDVESNEELRERAKDAVGGASEGGTADGIKAFITNNVEGVQAGDVIIDEFTQGRDGIGGVAPFVDVIVDGGIESDVREAIEFSRPVGIQHNLIRPQAVQIGGDISVFGVDIDTTLVLKTIKDFFLELGIGEKFFEDQLVRDVMNADSDIQNTKQNLFVERVTNESFIYSEDVVGAFVEFSGQLTNVTIVANGRGAPQSEILPPQLVVDDSYYFASDNPFSELTIQVALPGAGTYQVEWEYRASGQWESLDNVNDETNGFRVPGSNSVSWDIPLDWSSFDLGVAGVSAGEPVEDSFFVRARISSIDNITSQPLPAGIDITGSGYSLDYTYEDSNGSISVIDQRLNSFNEGADFEVIDNSGDGFPETLVWTGGLTPVQNEVFSVDYDVTVDGQTPPDDKYGTDLVRDEEFFFDRDTTETFLFDSGVDLYQMEDIPFETPNTPAVLDENGDAFVKGTDYELVDDTGNGFAQTIDWSLSGDTPVNNKEFTVVYTKKVFETELEVVATPQKLIRISSGGTFEEEVDFDIVDLNEDGADDAISWKDETLPIQDGEQFFLTYVTRGDINFDNREKADPGTLSVQVK